MVVVGIDYSMTSPSVCVHTGETWSLDNCVFHFRTDSNRMAKSFGNIHGHAIEKWSSQEERFLNSAKWVERIVNAIEGGVRHVTIEGYAMGAKGMVFHIGENTGLLKNTIWRLGIPFDTPAPGAIKKFSTGKGNANKEKMEEAFLEQTGFDVKAAIGQKSGFTPSGDIIDSYYMAKWAFHKVQQNQ